MDRLGVSEDDQRDLWEREEDKCSPRSPEALAQTTGPADTLRRRCPDLRPRPCLTQPSPFRRSPRTEAAGRRLHRPPRAQSDGLRPKF